MKICITSQGDNLNAEVDPRFGRCMYFVFVNTDTLEFEAVRNPYVDTVGGAGIQSGQFVASKQIKVVLTGNIGPNAIQTLQAAGIEVVTGLSGSVEGAVKKFKSGQYKSTSEPNVASHYGTGKGTLE